MERLRWEGEKEKNGGCGGGGRCMLRSVNEVLMLMMMILITMLRMYSMQ